MASRRPIDAPDLPAWRRGRSEDEDETPTLSGMDDALDSEETQWEALPPSDSVAARWASVSPAGFMTDTDPGAKVPNETPAIEPTAASILTPQPMGQPKEDPRALAQRLAAEAKARLSQPAQPAEDPRELAIRLAAEAKARTSRTPAPVPAPAAEDPRALAIRLTEQAKAKARAATPPGVSLARQAAGRSTPAPSNGRADLVAAPMYTPASPSPAPSVAHEPEPAQEAEAAAPSEEQPAEDPRQLAKRLAAEAKARMTPGPAPEASAPKKPAKKRTLAERAASKPKSAKEILEAAMRGESATPEDPSEAETDLPPFEPASHASPPQPEAQVEPQADLPPFVPAAPPPRAAAAKAQPAPSASGAAVLLDLLPGAAVEAPIPVARPDVFQAVWRAHRTRAQHEQDWPTVAAASVLIDAASRVPSGSLVGARVTLGGVPYAVFADIDRRVILAVVQPAEVYLAGLSG